MYLVRVTHLSHNISYYFRSFDIKDGVYKPIGVFKYRACKFATRFRSIKDACLVVRLIDRSLYRPLIVKADFNEYGILRSGG